MTTIRNSGAGRHFTERGAPMNGWRPGSARLPTYIHQSWDRSPERRAGARSRPLRPALRSRTSTCSAASCNAVPVLDRLHGDMSRVFRSPSPSPMRMPGHPSPGHGPVVGRASRQACFAPGFDYSEATVGTNGVGTAVEARMPVYIDGTQHFNEELHEFTCAGTPIHDRSVGKLEGFSTSVAWPGMRIR